MKKSYLLLSFMFLLSVFFSCRNDIVGDCKDSIGVERKEVLFNAGKDSIELRTKKGDDWWLSGITIRDSVYNSFSADDKVITAGGLSVEKTGRKSVFIRIEPNLTDAERKFTVWFQDGNCFNRIHITQKVKE